MPKRTLNPPLVSACAPTSSRLIILALSPQFRKFPPHYTPVMLAVAIERLDECSYHIAVQHIRHVIVRHQPEGSAVAGGCQGDEDTWGGSGCHIAPFARSRVIAFDQRVGGRGRGHGGQGLHGSGGIGGTRAALLAAANGGAGDCHR